MNQLIKPFLPDLEIVQQVFWPVLALTICSAAFVGWLRVKQRVRIPYTRKIFHFIIFSAAGLFQYYYGLQAVSLMGGMVFLLVLVAVFFGDKIWFYQALARETDAPHQKKFIILPLLATAIGGIIANILFPETAFIGYFVGGWGDAIGEPVGTRWGKHRYTVPILFGVGATRSLEGSLAVFIVSATIAATLCILQVTALPFGMALLVGISCGFAAAFVEAISSHGLDNLTIQLAAAGVLHYVLF
jgi:phytol kinase